MSSINFDNVYLLFLAIPLAVLLLVPFFIAVRKENVNFHNVTSGALHVLMAVIVAFTAAGTTVETTITQTDVYVLADVSYSASKNLDTIDNYIRALSGNLPRNARMGVVCFAKDQELLVPLGGRLKSVKDAASLLDTGETDIESALSEVGDLFRPDVIKRVVLITDGKQTHVSDSNALKRAVDSLRASKIFVDAIYLDDNISSDSREVQIDGAEVTQNAYLNSEQEAVVTLRSTYDTEATLTIYRNGEKLIDRATKLKNGYNTESFTLDTTEKGTYDYEVRVVADGDESKLNNNVTFTQTVSDGMNILLITESQEDCDRIESTYGSTATITSYVNQTVGIPCAVEDLCAYDEIIVADADLSRLQNSSMFLESLDTAISLFGKSLVTIGNVSVQSKEDGDLKSLGDMLPVRFGNVDQDAKLYTLVIDASRSMETLEKLTIAKRAAVQLVKYLNEGDNVTVVTFNGDFQVVQAPVSISDKKANNQPKTTRESVIESIENISAAQGTYIGLGLKEAYNRIKDLSYGEKQVMLITDGLTYTSEGDDKKETYDTVSAMQRLGIVVSVIDVGRGGATDITAEEAQAFLTNIADRGKGNYFYTPSVKELDNVLFGEIADNVTETIVETQSGVVIKKTSDEVLKGVDLRHAYVNGFVNSKAKAGATTVLAVTYDKTSGNTVDVPLYAYWNYGNGRVSSFTSSMNGDWISPWDNELGTRTTNTFFENVLSTNTPAERAEYPFVVDILADEGYVSVTLTPAVMRTNVTTEITVTSPGEKEGETKVTTEQMVFGSSTYSYRFAASDVGKYEISIRYTYENNGTYTANYVYTVPYLSEYDSFAVFDSSVLHKMIGSEGVVSENGVLKIENDESLVSKYVMDLTIPLLIVCVSLFVVDVVIRKLKWDDIRSLFGKRKK